MGKYFAKRLGMAILTIFLVACLTFLLMNAVPGSPWLSEKTPSETTLAALNAKYGLDKPVYVQLFMYLKIFFTVTSVYHLRCRRTVQFLTLSWICSRYLPR